MLGIADHGAFCAFCAFCAFAHTVSAQVRAHRRLARALEKLAGVFLIGFGIRLGTQ
jgi:threonine/homoserine/homoserine lactone efflux protein